MQLGMPQLSLGTRLAGPTSSPIGPATKALRSELARSADPARDRAQDRALTRSARTITATRAREGLYADLQDRLGRLGAAATTARTQVSGGVMSDTALGALRDLAERLDDVAAILDGAAGPEGAFRDDALLRDLRDAVGALAADRPAALGEPAARLFADGAQALQDKRDQAPLERRLAEQAVNAQAELGRLKTQQATLLHQQAALEQRQAAAKQQAGALEEARERLTAAPEPAGPAPAPGTAPVLSAGMTP